jgi:hypothetical protein
MDRSLLARCEEIRAGMRRAIRDPFAEPMLLQPATAALRFGCGFVAL